MKVRKLSGFITTALAFALLPAAISAQQVEYYHPDALGSVRAVTDESGDVITRHDYYPYGEEWNEPASNDTRRFTGKERDDENGFDYFGARYYGRNIGRFSAIDPLNNWNASILDPQRWNRYAYGRNNPIRFVDPNGEDFLDIVSGASNAFGSNFWLGAGRLDPYNSDFAIGQSVGDAASMAYGIYEASFGATIAGGGGLATASGVLSPVGAPAAVVGSAIAVHGVGVTVTAALHLSQATPKPGSAGSAGEGSPKPSPNFKPPTNPPQRPPSEIPRGWRVREMPPTEQYPNGYWKMEKPMRDGSWQPIDPSTMKPGGPAETHIAFPPKGR